MTIRLSHSASTRYTDCGKSYQYHYIKGYRAKVQSSALLFGTAIDRATEEYVKTLDFKLALEMFNNTWERQDVNKVPTDIRFLTDFTYSNKDLDLDLLKEYDYNQIKSDLNASKEDIDRTIHKKLELGYAALTEEEKKLFNYTNWLCLRSKGYYLLKEFKRIIDANMIELLGTQVQVDLENEDKDSVIGMADLVVRWKGFDKPVVLDVKTSSRDYEEDSVRKSPQLSLYVFDLSAKYEDTRNAGFIVLNKNIQKNKKKVCSKCKHDGTGGRHKTCDNVVDGTRCNGEWNETFRPIGRSQVIVEPISEVLVERVVENFNEVNKAIKAEVFPRNFSNCIKYNGAVKCAFYDLCHHNDMKDIICKEKE